MKAAEAVGVEVDYHLRYFRAPDRFRHLDRTEEHDVHALDVGSWSQIAAGVYILRRNECLKLYEL